MCWTKMIWLKLMVSTLYLYLPHFMLIHLEGILLLESKLKHEVRKFVSSLLKYRDVQCSSLYKEPPRVFTTTNTPTTPRRVPFSPPNG